MNATHGRVLVVEDERDIRDLITLHLKRAGYSIDEANNGEEAIQKVRTSSYHLIVLDWMLPQASGLDVLRVLRENPAHVSTPVLMLTARASTSDIVFGLESGADDYMTKPFEPVVLLARSRALLRRATSESPASGQDGDHDEMIRIGDLTVDSRSYEVKHNGQVLQLTPSEFKLLHALAANRGRVLTRDQLIQLVQGDGVAVVDRAIDTHVFGLRKKMAEAAHFIETVRGIGYRINFTQSVPSQ